MYVRGCEILNRKDAVKQVFLLSGALIAFHIGSGFASGQEILQFFTVYGPIKSAVGFLTAWLCFTLVSMFVMLRCFKLHSALNGRSAYKFLCTEKAADIFFCITPFLMFLTYGVMLSGTGSVLYDFYGFPKIAGRFAMAVLVLGTVLLGLKKLVQVIGSLGPFIIVLVFILGVLGIIKSPKNIFADYSPLFINMKKAAPDFFLSAVFYSGFAILSGISFFTGITYGIKSKKRAVAVAVLGNTAYIAAAAIMNIALYANLPLVYNSQTPSVVLAGEISPLFAKIFIAVMLLGAYTTAVPMLWSIASNLEKDEKSLWYKLFCILLSLISVVIGGLPFDLLLSIIYPAIGFCGVLLAVDMLVKYYKSRGKRH